MKLKFLQDFSWETRKSLKRHRKLRFYLGLINFTVQELQEENERLKDCIKKNGQWLVYGHPYGLKETDIPK